VSLDQRLESRNLSSAGASPEAPEVDENDLSAVVGELELDTVDVLGREVRNFLADLEEHRLEARAGERLTEHFLEFYADQYGKEYRPMSDRLRDSFCAYAWPGNVRELENLVKRMVVLGTEEPVIEELVKRSTEVVVPGNGNGNGHGNGGGRMSELQRFMAGEVEHVSLKRIARDAANAAERRLIEKVLHRTRWNRKEAAEILQISYKALLYKIKENGLSEVR